MKVRESQLISERTKQLVVRSLKRHGFEPFGSDEEYKKIVSTSYPISGAIVKSRLKMWIPNTSVRATVGAKRVCFYQVKEGVVSNLTRQLTTIMSRVRSAAKHYYGLAEAERGSNG